MAERLGAVLPTVLKQVAVRQRALASVQRRWRTLVGRALAEHSRPVSLRRGRLVVHVDYPGDSFALSFERARLLKRLKQQTAGDVDELVIRAGEVSGRTASGPPPRRASKRRPGSHI